MYTLYLGRVINSQHGELDFGCWSIAQAVQLLYNQFWLTARLVGPNGEQFILTEHEASDADGNEWVEFDFVPKN